MSEQATPSMTYAEWNALSKAELWNEWGEPGDLHNLLDEWAEKLEDAYAVLRDLASTPSNSANELSYEDLHQRARAWCGEVSE